MVSAQIYYRLMTPLQIIQKKIDAIAKIEIYEGEELRMIGSGFYIGKDGHFITNHHVLKPFLENPAMQLKIYSRGGYDQVVEISILKCQDERKIDLCLLKIKDRHDKEYFDEEVPTEISQGLPLWSIGNCERDFNIKEHRSEKIWNDIYNYVNQVKNFRSQIPKNYNFGVKTLSLSPAPACQGKDCPQGLDHSPLCPGDSGGPIFSSNGQLIGVVAEKLTTEGSREIYYSTIWGQEVLKFFQTYKMQELPSLDKKRLVPKLDGFLESITSEPSTEKP